MKTQIYIYILFLITYIRNLQIPAHRCANFASNSLKKSLERCAGFGLSV